MIIKKTSSSSVSVPSLNKSNWWKYLLTLLLFLGFIGVAIQYFLPHSEPSKEQDKMAELTKGASNMPIGVITCDAETVQKDKFVGIDNRLFENGHTQSSEMARSGEKSSKITPAQKYGIGYNIHNPRPNERFHVSVWQYKTKGENGVIAASAAKADVFYKQSNKTTKKDTLGWELLELSFDIPVDVSIDVLKIYVYQRKDSELFLDDLRIEKLGEGTEEGTEDPSLHAPVFSLEIADKWMEKLKDKRLEAFQRGLLMTEDDDWVKGNILTDSVNAASETLKMPVKLRLKGDWLDHLEGNKWSYRIQVKDPHAWNRLKTFSIQNSETRGHLDEWVYHQWLRKEDVLSPRYDFIRTKVNGEDLGIYAYEEHFDKQLPEFMKRREGVIVRFTEDGFWAFKHRQIKSVGYYTDNHYTEDHGFKTTKVKAFKESRTLKSDNLKQQLEVAQNLMLQYQYGTQKASEIFDIERLAKYFAITDICRAYHSFRWHNQRFYYNPISTQLEPIGFDGGKMLPLQGDAPFLGYLIWNEHNSFENIIKALFADEEFITAYIRYLREFTGEDYMGNFLQGIAEDLNKREQWIREEIVDYTYNRKRIPEISKRIQLYLRPLPAESLSAFVHQKTDGELQLKLQNKHFAPLQILGFGKTKDRMTQRLAKPIYIPVTKQGTLPEYIHTTSEQNMNYVYFKQIGGEELLSSNINQWKAPDFETPYQTLFEGLKLESNEVFNVNEETKTIVFEAGEQQVKENIILPENYEVQIEAGCHLDLIEGAAFISKSPVFLYGTEEAPIKIYSSDQTANGFTVLKSDKKSILNYVLFEDLNTLNQANWTLTGAVNFYESDVDISYCTFTKNHCEDALNIIRSHFEIDKITVSHTFSDGFDADFCTGTLQNSRFYKTGNDCMDFSGSIITITNCTAEMSGDKGISVGEEAQVRITSASIDGATIGVASKDLSMVTIDNIILKNCTQAFAAYQKKAEFGGAKIKVQNYTAEKVSYLYQVEKGSSLELEGKLIEGE